MSLLEVIVAASLVTLVTAGVYTIYGPASTTAKVQTQSDFLSQLRRNVDSAYQTANTFSGISVAKAVSDKWYPSSNPEGSWGTFALAPATNPSTGTANDSWEASYAAVPGDACGRLAANQLNQWDEVTVGGTVVQSVQDAINECALHTTTEVAFVRYGGHRSNGAALSSLCFNLKSGAPIPADCPASGYAPPPPPYTNPTPLPPPVAVTPPPLTPPPSSGQPSGPVIGGLPATPSPPGTPGPAPSPPAVPVPPPPSYPSACTVPAPQTQTLVCPAGQTGSISQSRTASCPDPYGAVVWGAWATTSDTCAPSCVPPAPQYQNVDRDLGCTNGWVGQRIWSFEQIRTASCPPSGPYTWSSWTDTGNSSLVSNTCAAPCVAPPSGSQSGSQSAACPAGTVTPAGATSFTQTQTRTVLYSCPAPSGPYSTAYGPWSSWSPLASSACAPKCVAPATANTPQSQTASCPSGQVTSGGASSFTQSRTATTTYSCPAPTGGYTSSVSYSAWSPVYTSVCAPKCVAPAPRSYTASRPLDCIDGTTSTQSAPATDTYSCPAPTGPYTTSTTYGTWSPTRCGCVSIYAFVVVRRDGIEQVMLAGDVRVGDELKIMDSTTGKTRWGKVTYSKTETVPMVQVSTAAGVTLRCSETAPIGVITGEYVLATDLKGHQAAIEVDGRYGVSEVTEVQPLGLGSVQHITCENDYFLAGDEAGRYLAHHNKKVGYCVSVDAFVPIRRAGEEIEVRARDVREGDEVHGIDPRTGRLFWQPVTASDQALAPVVTFATADGVGLSCSQVAPIGLATGLGQEADRVLGRVIATMDRGSFGQGQVTMYKTRGTQEVQRIVCGEVFFLAGDVSGRYVTHHD